MIVVKSGFGLVEVPVGEDAIEDLAILKRVSPGVKIVVTKDKKEMMVPICTLFLPETHNEVFKPGVLIRLGNLRMG